MFWFVLQTEHEVLHLFNVVNAPNAVCCRLVAGQNTRLADSLQQTIDDSKFSSLVGEFTQQPSCEREIERDF